MDTRNPRQIWLSAFIFDAIPEPIIVDILGPLASRLLGSITAAAAMSLGAMSLVSYPKNATMQKRGARANDPVRLISI